MITPQLLVYFALAAIWLVVAGYFAFVYDGPRQVGQWLDTAFIIPAACLLAAWNLFRAYRYWRVRTRETTDGRSL